MGNRAASDKRKRALLLALLAAAPLLLALCLLAGASGFGLPDLRAEAGAAIFRLRLYRVAAGFLVGAGLSCAGVVFQALLRNPLAEPYVLGVSSGGALGAAVAILAGLGAISLAAVPLSAFAGAAASLFLVYSLASRRGSTSVYSLILSGVIVSSVASSLLMFLISVAPVEGMHSILWWMLGNLEVESPRLLVWSAVPMGLALAGLWSLAPELNSLTLGREMAHYLGVRTRVAIALGLGLATLVTAAAVGLAGLIGFVGLVVPHAVRSLVGPDHRRLLPATALCGGVFLALCDALARSLLTVEIPVGVLTSFVGGPFFLMLLRRRSSGWWN
jgi:iron complex transport system permease protein